MIFSRNKIRKPATAPKITGGLAGISSEDDVLDIAKTMVPQPAAPKPIDQGNAIKPQAPGSATSAPKYFGLNGAAPGGRDLNRPREVTPMTDPRAGMQKDAAKADAIRRGKDAARRKLRDQASDNQREIRDGVDYNGDGVIGTGIEGMAGGREMTNDDLINTAVRDLLEPIDNTGARSAADEALRQNIAESRLNARARGGMAGMGLTGATAAMEGTEARRGERERTLTMDEFDRRARQEQMDRSLAGIGAERESEIYDRILKELDKELETDELPDPDTDGDGNLSQEELDAARETRNQRNTTDAQRRNMEIESMTDAQFEGMNNKELERLGWRAEGPKGDGPNSPLYFLWTSPDGVEKRAYIDSGDPAEWLSSGLEWG